MENLVEIQGELESNSFHHVKPCDIFWRIMIEIAAALSQ